MVPPKVKGGPEVRRRLVALGSLLAALAMACGNAPSEPRSAGTTQAPVDSLPPVVWGSAMGSTDTVAGAVKVADGDTLRFYVLARDDRALAWVGFSAAGTINGQAVSYVDSLPVTDGGAAEELDGWLVEPAGVSGWLTLSGFARDSAGHRTTQSLTPNPVSLYALLPDSGPTATLPFDPATLSDVAYDPKHGTVYLAQMDSGRIFPLDVATMTFGTALVTPGSPRSVELSASNDSLVVTLDATPTLGVYDLQAPTAGWATVDLSAADSAGLSAEYVRVAPSGEAVITLRQGTAATASLLEHDFGTGAERLRSDVPGGGYIIMMSRPPSRRYLTMYGGTVVAFDAEADRWVTPTRQAPNFVFGVESDSDGLALALNSGEEIADVTTPSLSPQTLYAGGLYPLLSQSGDTLFDIEYRAGVTAWPELTITTTADRITRAAIPLPGQPWRLLLAYGTPARLLVFTGSALMSLALDSLPRPQAAAARRSERPQTLPTLRVSLRRPQTGR